jgi:aspartyl-tRNA(Asn)/glutamyl-tRNA(Gln) amidotransferase subunit A
MVSPFSSISQLGRALRRKEISSVELTKLYLGRLKTLGEEHHAVAHVTEELALKQAAAADNSAPSSALHGIPFGVKDLYSVANIPTRWGSPGHEDQVFPYTATSVQKLFDAGSVLIGKLEMIELAGGGDYDIAGASRGGACLSAWDKSRWAGGSSSGSGAATALGCVGYSLGSETSGSIICPSAFNGATGFRPTYGRVSRHGAMALCWTLDKLGPICRSAEDCGIVLSAMSGPDPLDPSSMSERLNLAAKRPRPRIGLVKEQFKENKADACEKAYGAALEVFKKLGYEVVDVALPDLPFGTAVGIIVAAEGASAHENFIRGDRFQLLADKNQVAGFTAALGIPAVDYLWAMRFRSEALKANSIWEKCDCIFRPVFYHGAPRVDQSLTVGFEHMGGDGDPANLLGWPAMAFPIGFEDGLPLGGQIIAPALREDTCYRVARDFQRETDWHKRVPQEAAI